MFVNQSIKTLFQHRVHLTKKCSCLEPCIVTDENSRITVYAKEVERSANNTFPEKGKLRLSKSRVCLDIE